MPTLRIQIKDEFMCKNSNVNIFQKKKDQNAGNKCGLKVKYTDKSFEG